MIYSNGLTPDLGIPNQDPTSAVSAPSRTPAVARPGGPGNAVAVDTIGADSARVSVAGSMLSEAMSGSDVRLDKVAALRQSIDAGTYNVPAAAVASKLVDTLLR